MTSASTLQADAADAPASATATPPTPPQSLWHIAWHKLRQDKVALLSALVLLAYLVVVLLTSVGLVAANWSQEVAAHYAPPTFAAPELAGKTVSSADASELQNQVLPENPRDTLAPILLELRRERGEKVNMPEVPIAVTDPLASILAGIGSKDASSASTSPIAVTDPLADVMARIAPSSATGAESGESVRTATAPLGADKWGRDVLQKTLKGAQTSFIVGLLAAVVATALGTLFGALAGYWGGRTDAVFNWVYSVFTSVPYLLLILAVAAVLQQKGVLTIVLILGLTGWTGVFRLIRAEYMKHRSREYVRAAEAIGVSHRSRIVRHILPNVSHVMLVQMSILTVGFIKSEVILSFLGFGVPVDSVSWGSMLNEAQNELLLGYWWQMLAASVAMAGLVTAFSLFTDALRDALDPKLK